MFTSISVVIPVYNSSNSLDELYNKLSSTVQKLTNNYEIILVDDGSTDDSYLKMQELHRKDCRIKIIKLNGNFGQQNAIMCGFHHAKGEYILNLDDDLQHPPEEIERLLNKLQEGYDVVYGIPLVKQHSLYRNIGSKMTNLLFDFLLSKPPKVKISSFRAMRKSLVQKIIKNNYSFVYISAIVFKHTKNAENIYVTHNSRKHGKSNYNFKKLFKLYAKLYIYYCPFSFLKYFTSSKVQFEIKEIQF
jgi:polyisoprenyl-phosphate glycosyltransferase